MMSIMEGTDDVDLGPLGLSGEKKRNKLGYHRSSMACVENLVKVNCRKRKIRCLQDKNDVQGRCVTCIRLRKECFYEPVDHAPSGDPNQVGSTTAFPMGQSMSSPSMTPGHPSSRSQSAQHQAQLATVQSMGQLSVRDEGGSDYTTSQNMPSSAPGYWASSESAAVTPSFSAYASSHHHHHHQPEWPPAAAAGGSGAGEAVVSRSSEDAWSTTTTYSQATTTARSLSYSGGGGEHAHAGYLPSSRSPYERRASASVVASSDMYHPPGTAAAALSAGAMPSSTTYAAWQQPQPQYQYAKSSGSEEYGSGGGWYDETGGSGQPGAHGGANLYYGGR
ncbi:hypothetical protein SLS62_006057 [Diatrype stigma]|uniref:Zn(2)-C6 fungal-type domain-containing protein n=1 Tax=Diatrype stigma TaxID=117547 RepID=A0AAN9YPD9_9PEZI